MFGLESVVDAETDEKADVTRHPCDGTSRADGELLASRTADNPTTPWFPPRSLSSGGISSPLPTEIQGQSSFMFISGATA